MGGDFEGYRVLDLSDEKGVLCGKMLADLGADVKKGGATRRVPMLQHRSLLLILGTKDGEFHG